MCLITNKTIDNLPVGQNDAFSPVCITIGNIGCVFSRHSSRRDDTFQKRVNYYHEKHRTVSRRSPRPYHPESVKKKSLEEILRELREIDIRSVNPAELVDIENVCIRTDLPVEERLRDYISQIKNPYCYRSHGVTVKISFAGKRKLEECLMSCIEMECGGIPDEEITMEGRCVG